jgi:hypothetical protein
MLLVLQKTAYIIPVNAGTAAYIAPLVSKSSPISSPPEMSRADSVAHPLTTHTAQTSLAFRRV